MINAWLEGHEVEIIALLLLGIVLLGTMGGAFVDCCASVWDWLKRGD